jgi:hypothetical protein
MNHANIGARHVQAGNSARPTSTINAPALQDVQFGHVSRGAAARDVVADGVVAVDGPRGLVPAETGDIDQVEFVQARSCMSCEFMNMTVRRPFRPR